jgi:hypothetical protein
MDKTTVRKYRTNGTSIERSARALEALNTFVQRHGTALVPTTAVQDGYKLGAWVAYARARHRGGLMTEELAELLENLPGWQWGPLPPGPGSKNDRNREILEKVSSGLSLSQVATEYGVSRQRIHQIVKRDTAE